MGLFRKSKDTMRREISKDLERILSTPEAKRRMALRQSGYDGWIDMDGYATDGKGHRIDPKTGKRK